MKQLNQWMHAHPYKACAFTHTFTMFAVCRAFRDDWSNVTTGSFFFTLFIWALIVSLDVRRFTALLVAAAMIASPIRARAQQQESPGGIAAGAVIIVAGAVVTVWLIKKCNKWFPRGAVGTTNVMERFLPASEEYGACFTYNDGTTCEAERLVPLIPTVTTIDIEGTNVVIKSQRGEDYANDLAGFREAVNAHGLDLTQAESYSRNLQPCKPELVPIKFDWTTGIVRRGGGALVAVERSYDLQHWDRLLRIESRDHLRVVDATTTDTAFYRVTTAEP